MPPPLNLAKPKPRPALPPFTRTARSVSAALLVVLAAAAIRGGAESLPWVANLAERLGFPRGHGPRLLAGILLAMAGLIVLAPSWSRRVALVASATLVFAGIASTSGIRATRQAGPDGPGLSGLEALLVAGTALAAVAIGLLVAMKAYRSVPPESRGLSSAWRIAAAFVALGTALAVAAPAAPPRATADPARLPERTAPDLTEPDSGAIEIASIDLDVAAWVGRPLAETSLATHLPDLAGRLGNEPAFLVLYNVRCGTCHDLFRERFAGELTRRVLAIEIPPAADAMLIESDAPAAIDCPDCERLSLPSGPRWLVRPPTVVRIENGLIACVDDASDGSCFTAP